VNFPEAAYAGGGNAGYGPSGTGNLGNISGLFTDYNPASDLRGTGTYAGNAGNNFAHNNVQPTRTVTTLIKL
jgi:hypothetical protein